MRLCGVVATLAAFTTFVAGQAPSINDYSNAEILSGSAFQNISDIADGNMQYNIGQRTNATCTYANAKVRKEWRTLSPSTRKAYTDAVKCLQNLPPQVMTPDQASQYPGVKSRHDEFVATHINYTFAIHDTADFFAWHRAFVQFLENDLQSLCGYNDVMPYWNWALDSAAPQNSPLFSGDEYSMGSDGAFIANRSSTWLALEDITYDPGFGGGCISSGPFSNYTVNLGPLDSASSKNVDTPFQYNPRCLVRDLNPWFSSRYNSFDNVTRLILEQIYVENFQDLAQGWGSPTNKFGVHGGGHWLVGGWMADLHSSPSDPIFFLHHGMLDRIWTIWQNLDIFRRQDIIRGTSTFGNEPASAPMTLDDVISFGFVTNSYRFGDLMDTFSGPFCYRYE